MPHCIIEYPESLEETTDIQPLCNEVQQLVIDSGLFAPNAIKTRAIPYSYYCVGEDSDQSPFIHITISILDGRTVEQREKLSTTIFDYLKNTFPDISHLSVNIHEMCKDTYKK